LLKHTYICSRFCCSVAQRRCYSLARDIKDQSVRNIRKACYWRSSRDRGPSRKDRAVSDECLRILLTWYTIEGDRAVSREARRAPEASKGTLTTLVAAKRLGRRHPANTSYPTIQKTKQKTNVPRCSDVRISCFSATLR